MGESFTEGAIEEGIASKDSRVSLPEIEIESSNSFERELGNLQCISLIELVADSFVSSIDKPNSSMAVGFRFGLWEVDAGGPFTTRFLDIVRDNSEADGSAEELRLGVQSLATGVMLPNEPLAAAFLNAGPD